MSFRVIIPRRWRGKDFENDTFCRIFVKKKGWFRAV